ncbi:VOC family protein [uncultured Tateyamaria sp.]|uniref:VOC family protein n=1 Tax=Tateyamaria sp. 1078 TaxID=3417464 RepID=UPI002639F115|nr:VOC family protein [uncultured Tateyamaria sp.]
MNQPRLTQIDHLVLTVSDIDTTIAFYRDVLGMEHAPFVVADGSTRHALRFGPHKINLHLAGAEFDPKARAPSPGTADLCLLTDADLDKWQAHFAATHTRIEEGPVPRSGATGPITSLYVRDPDGNLIEISVPQPVAPPRADRS